MEVCTTRQRFIFTTFCDCKKKGADKMAIEKGLLIHWWHYYGKCIYTFAELKEFEKLAEANPNKVQLIAINVDGDKVDTKAVVAKRQLTLPVIKDQLKITAERYQLIGTPTSFVITPEGNIQAKYEGAIPAADLDKLFKG